VHPASRRILGVIDVHLALDAVDVQLAGHRRQIVLSLLLGAIGLCLFSVAFVWLVLHRPVRALLSGTNRLARGELATRLEVRSEDELGVLAGSFNHMAAELQRAHADLTDWAHTLETRVKQKTEELEQTHRGLINTEKLASLGKLAATVAHEVNNPLFGMLTYARLVRKDVERLPATDPARVRMLEHLAVIERESKRCGGLMKNLLAFARQSPPQRAPMNCNLVLRRAAELISHKLELNEIALGLKEDPALPEIQGDAAQLQQVLLALLVNAAEAIGRDGRITATTAALPAGEGVSISVLDTGPGIPYAIQTQIFEPFFSTKSSQHRTGLGLAISKGIVERHGGIITVRSDPGHGAEFLIQLPPAAPVHAAAGNSAEAV
jgi:two-component system NtrC family sensor kinase